MATINDVAKLANVSNATVSHVINKTRKVNPETIEKVQWAIRELNYRPNELARGLKTGNSRLIGVLNYYSIDMYFAEVLTSLEAAAYQAGYDVMLRHTERDGENQGDAISAWINKNIDGLIINSPYIDDEFYELIDQVNCPCVIMHIDDDNFKGDVIRGTDLQASKEAVKYLIGLGHEKIACIEGIAYDFHTASYRRTGYEKALQEAGMPVREEYIIHTDYDIDEGYQAFKTLMSMPEPPTAIFTYYDLLAIGALRAAADMGIRVPEEVSIMGFDDIMLTKYTTPRLTSIDQNKQRIGEMAVQMIIDRINDASLPPRQVVLPMNLVVRESTGPVNQPHA